MDLWRQKFEKYFFKKESELEKEIRSLPFEEKSELIGIAFILFKTAICQIKQRLPWTDENLHPNHLSNFI